MRKLLNLIMLSAAIVFVGFGKPAEASMIGMTRGLRAVYDHIRFETPTMPPMAFSLFCLRYAGDCKPQHLVFRGGPLKMTEQRWAELRDVNARVNGSIRPLPNLGGVATEEWLINPAKGDCNDYAVTKRHELLEKGWPSRSLLLAEVVMPSGEHHLVVVVRARQGDFVLDNMASSIRPWTQTPYRWVRIQSAANPKFWSSVKPVARSV